MDTPESHLIYSHSLDHSTDQVMEWLAYWGETVVRKNFDADIQQQMSYYLGTEVESIQHYASIWYRKWHRMLMHEAQQANGFLKADFESNANEFNQLLYDEAQVVHDYHFTKYKANLVLSQYFPSPINKISVLQYAQEAGLQIPRTLITQNREDVLRFFHTCDQGIINKSIADHLMFFCDPSTGEGFSNYTEELSWEAIQKLPKQFGMSLFQEKLDKAYELRTFFIGGSCYSMAIFSQQNKESRVDSRRVPQQGSNRRTNYQLAEAEEAKIKLLMESLSLNIGALDFIKTTEGKLYFLEVNPSGQFGTASYYCNYPLYKIVATYLSQHESST